MSSNLPPAVSHRHADVTGGWLRAATFGAMDGLVSNTALIAGVAAAGSAQAVVLAGIAGLLAGAFSMALGEYTSVTTANEQIEAEVRVERRAFRLEPDAEKAELVQMFEQLGLSPNTAAAATEELHRNEKQALNFHLVSELGVDPTARPSPWVAAGSSFVLFALGAVIPLIPYLLGYQSLLPGLFCGALGLLIAGASAALITKKPVLLGGVRQLLLGGAAIAATYGVGLLVGVSVS